MSRAQNLAEGDGKALKDVNEILQLLFRSGHFQIRYPMQDTEHACKIFKLVWQ